MLYPWHGIYIRSSLTVNILLSIAWYNVTCKDVQGVFTVNFTLAMSDHGPTQLSTVYNFHRMRHLQHTQKQGHACGLMGMRYSGCWKIFPRGSQKIDPKSAAFYVGSFTRKSKKADAFVGWGITATSNNTELWHFEEKGVISLMFLAAQVYDFTH